MRAGQALLTASAVAAALNAPCSARAEPRAPYVVALAADGAWLVPSRDHVALSGDLPSAQSAAPEPEAVRLVFVGFTSAPSGVNVSSLHANGQLLDALAVPALTAAPCPPESVGPCWGTPPLRLTPDRVDRDYLAARERSLEAELGGELQVEVGARPQPRWRIGAPRSPLFAGIDRLSLTLRVRILRIAPGGAPSIGGDSGTALSMARSEVLAASKIWAQCGVDLLGPAGPEIRVVDPPPVALVAVGCDAGLPASGGRIALRVRGHSVRIPTHAGEAPRVVAERLARALRALGVGVRISPNARIDTGASGAIDVLLSGASGRPLEVAADPDPQLPLSSDATLGVCLGEVDLGNGLSHFVEHDAAAGTLEERALIKAFDDGDPRTVEVLIVPSFDQSGRIGESFIDDSGAGIQNTIVLDRAALRAGPRSYALAHELGHILLDLPGHPDDYGVDQSGSLMDSDASDASVYGPRRLSLAECERMLLESGPGALIPLLERWPLPPVSQPAQHAPTISGR